MAKRTSHQDAQKSDTLVAPMGSMGLDAAFDICACGATILKKKWTNNGWIALPAPMSPVEDTEHTCQS